MMCNNPKLDLVNVNAYIKFGEILSFFIKILSVNEIQHKSSAIPLVQMCEKLLATIPT